MPGDRVLLLFTHGTMGARTLRLRSLLFTSTTCGPLLTHFSVGAPNLLLRSTAHHQRLHLHALVSFVGVSIRRSTALAKPKRLGYLSATAYREDGLEFRIWPNDHTPPHVHAWKAGGMAKIKLVDGFDVVKVREIMPIDVVRAVRIVIASEGKLMQAWEEIHGY